MKEYLPGARQGIGTRPDIKKKKKKMGGKVRREIRVQ